MLYVEAAKDSTYGAARLSLIARTTHLLAVGWGLIAIRSWLQENRPHSHGVGESIPVRYCEQRGSDETALNPTAYAASTAF